MKHITKFLLATALLAGVSGCGDGFLEVLPPSYNPDQYFIKTPSDLNQVLASAYDALTYDDCMGLVWLFGELPADNVDVTTLSNLDWKAAYNRSTGVFLGPTQSVMTATYKAAFRANLVLENLDAVEGLSAEDKTRLRAEAQFIRAIAHFELVRIFAQPYGFSGSINGNAYDNNAHPGIALRLKANTEQLSRNTVSEVYNQIIADLKAAEANLPATAATPGHASKWGAKGYLAKVYFQMNDWTNAYTAANDVIANGGFMLDSLQGRFSPNVSSEAVFYLRSTDLNNDNAGSFIRGNFRFDPSRGLANVGVSTNLVTESKSQVGDDRGSSWYIISKGLYFSRKFRAADTTFIQVPLCHLTELKLIRAESAAELSTDLNTAMQDLNDIKNRAGVPVLTNPDPVQLINEARRERRIELAMEGNRLHELKRQAVAKASKVFINDLQIRGAIWSCNGMVMQIPSNELSGNLNYEPNPIGGCD